MDRVARTARSARRLGGRCPRRAGGRGVRVAAVRHLEGHGFHPARRHGAAREAPEGHAGCWFRFESLVAVPVRRLALLRARRVAAEPAGAVCLPDLQSGAVRAHAADGRRPLAILRRSAAADSEFGRGVAAGHVHRGHHLPRGVDRDAGFVRVLRPCRNGQDAARHARQTHRTGHAAHRQRLAVAIRARDGVPVPARRADRSVQGSHRHPRHHGLDRRVRRDRTRSRAA